ncbi:hypothetical protein RB597_002976 [Gaeumannomyces tritici]
MPAIQHLLPYAHKLLFARSSVNGTVNDGDLAKVVGWVASSKDRGTVDILWSSCLTIFLCVWIATYPNAPSPNDKWYHHFVDKLNLALIGFLGPDFLFGLAIGQLASAKKSVKMFREAPELSHGTTWTLTHGFFADMGGFHLRASDFPQGFPINAEQLFYLIKHGHLDFPILTKEEIGSRSKVDNLSKIITVWQAFWFVVTEIQRITRGYPITTLELTAMSFAVVMIATSASWYFKPSISQVIILDTKDNRTIRAIRNFARLETHPGLPHKYYRTPLDFISRRGFHLERHWRYYSELTYWVHFPLFNRQMNVTPWDRFPSDIFLPVDDLILILFGFFIQAPFSVCLLVAWNFHFPTTAERDLWRVCSVYHSVFSFLGMVYFSIHLFTLWKMAGKGKDKRASTGSGSNSNNVLRLPTTDEEISLTRRGAEDSDMSEAADAARPVVHRKTGLPKSMSRFEAWLVQWRNISPDQDPDMEVPLRWIAPIFLASATYIFCRLYIYIEDFVGLRSQPQGVYMTVNKFVPFL